MVKARIIPQPIGNVKGGEYVADRRKNRKKRREPVTAPGFNDRKFGEDATREDIRKGNYTRVTRVYLDENDPS